MSDSDVYRRLNIALAKVPDLLQDVSIALSIFDAVDDDEHKQELSDWLVEFMVNTGFLHMARQAIEEKGEVDTVSKQLMELCLTKIVLGKEQLVELMDLAREAHQREKDRA